MKKIYFMLGPYIAKDEGVISYKGNKIFKPIDDILKINVPVDEIENRVEQIHDDEMWSHISKINHTINKTANEFFEEIGAIFTLLPLITRMISSPGAVYGKEAINYTTDTCPIKLKWFEMEKEAFLSESSQIYLELALTQKNINKVYSIYNSFRKEKADFTHLSEFHHIEFEGNVDQNENENIALELIKRIIKDLIKNNYEDISYFIDDKKIKELENLSKNIKKIPRITFKEALEKLYEKTKNEKYKKFTLKNFGAWEEIKITEIFGTMVLIKEYPLLEVPFYHATAKNNKKVADNADIIWPGYREIVGSGHRIESVNELENKSKIFNLPKEDYSPYLQSRKLNKYKSSSGFGLGWERLLQGLLEMPFIWSSNHFPRVDQTLKP